MVVRANRHFNGFEQRYLFKGTAVHDRSHFPS